MADILRDRGHFDVFISVSGTEYGFNLTEGEGGKLSYQPGLVEEIAAQQSLGGISYEAQPSSISVFDAFEDWSDGAGAEHTAPGETKPKSYSYSRGVDASWGNQLYLSPQLQSMTGLTTSLTKVVRTAAGVFGLGGRYIYHLHSAQWVSHYDAGASAVFTDLVEYGNGTSSFLVAALGDSQDMVYSTDNGDNWAASTGNKATFLGVRGTATVIPVLLSITVAGLIKTSVNVTSFSNADRVGQTTETVNSMVVANNKAWVFKREGIYVWDGTTSSSFLPLPALYRTGNGLNAFLWIDGSIYASYGGRIIKVDAVANTFETVFLTQHPELNGTIAGITGDTAFLYFALTNSAGATYVMKGNPTVGAWHTLGYLGVVTPSFITTLPSTVPHASNPTLVFGNGSSTASYYVLPRDGLRPEDDENYLYDTAGGTLYQSVSDGGALAFPKYLNSARLVGASMTAARSAIVKYALDESTTFTTILTGVSPGLSKASLTTPVSFAQQQASITLATGDNQHSPRVRGYAFDTTPAQPRRQQWTLGVHLDDGAAAQGDSGKASFVELYDFLFNACRNGLQVTYGDYFGNSYTAKIRDMQGGGLVPKATGKGRRAVSCDFTLVIAEIQPAGLTTSTFIWGESGWGSGDVYGTS